MPRDYAPLASRLLVPGARLPVPGQGATRLGLDSPASDLMTDFMVVPPASIEAGATVDEANQFMIRRAVRSLLVTDPSRRVLGFVTAHDVLGERPVSIALERKIARTEVLVRDVMTPAERLEVLRIDDVEIGRAHV